MRRGILDWNGEGEAVGGIVIVRYGADTLQTIDRVKTRLAELSKSLPSDEKPETFFNQIGLLRKNDFAFRQRGESGLWVSDLFPHISTCIDDIAVLRSCYGDMVVHSAAPGAN